MTQAIDTMAPQFGSGAAAKQLAQQVGHNVSEVSGADLFRIVDALQGQGRQAFRTGRDIVQIGGKRIHVVPHGSYNVSAGSKIGKQILNVQA